MRTHASPRHLGRMLPALAMVLAATIPSGVTTLAGAQTATPTPPTGQVLFSDDFSDPDSGWGGDTLSSGAVFAYGTNEYLITPAAGHVDFNGAPYAEGQADLIQSVEIRLPSGSATGNVGSGLTCGRPTTSDAQYHFFVWPDGVWSINRRDAADSKVVAVIHGHLEGNGIAPGALISVVSVCETVLSGESGVSHLSFFIQGQRVADVNDPWALSADSGWRGGIITTGSDHGPQQAVHFMHFSISTGTGSGTPSGPASVGAPVAASNTPLPWLAIIAGVVGFLAAGLVISRKRKRHPAAPTYPTFPESSLPPPPPPL
jgi:hypothetical protein